MSDKECPSCHRSCDEVYQCDDCHHMFCRNCGKSAFFAGGPVADQGCPICEWSFFGGQTVVSSDDDPASDEDVREESVSSESVETPSESSYSSADCGSSSSATEYSGSANAEISNEGKALLTVGIIVLAVIALAMPDHPTVYQTPTNQPSQTPTAQTSQAGQSRSLYCTGFSADGRYCYAEGTGWVEIHPQNVPPPPPIDLNPSVKLSADTTLSGIDDSKDALAYCAKVVNMGAGEIELADSGYTGEQPPNVVVQAMMKWNSGIDGPYAWRCMHGHVYGCYIGASGRGCRVARTDEEQMLEIRKFCEQNPNADFVPNAVNYSASSWRCNGSIPVVIESYPVDDEYYIKGSWVKIEP